LGDIKGYDGGTADMHIGPITFYLAYCDHVVIYHFKPLTLDTAACEITWLVNERAEEGKDYSLKELIWLWDVTTIADKCIIENNQKGVNSRFYQPGPFTKMEEFEQGFVDWYIDLMK
jgi:phenylpropionate dioxygenase-like ring-hydroxylating dioxygenase large terminal subunit